MSALCAKCEWPVERHGPMTHAFVHPTVPDPDVPKRLCMALSVDVDRHPDRKLMRDWGKVFADNGVHGVDAIRQRCAEMRAKGFAVFPPCDNTDARGYCQGHRS